jgi:flagellar biosynthesis/type III secretory pathway protein FliH
LEEERREGRIEGQKEGRERINELNRRLLKDGC